MQKLSSRERIVMALNHKEPDLVPIDFGGTSNSVPAETAHKRLAEYLKLDNIKSEFQSIVTQCVYPDPRLMERFRTDVSMVQAGKPDSWELVINKETGEWVDEWGATFHKPEGVMFYEWKTHPLEGLDEISFIKKKKFPDPTDQGRYRELKNKTEDLFNNTDKAILLNSAFGMWEQYFVLRGIEQALMDLVVDQKYVEYVFDILCDWLLEFYSRALEHVGKYVQIVKINDDLGFKTGPMFNPEIYRKIIKPRHKKIVELIKSRTDARVYIHSDGSIVEYLPDFIEIGIDIINPVEIDANGMNPENLKKKFGRDLTFWGGGCDNTTLEHGTPEEVAEQAKRNVSIFAPGGGFVFSSVHCIQPFVKPQNIIALFDSALKYKNH